MSEQGEVGRTNAARCREQDGYFGVSLNRSGQPKPYQAKVSRGGEQVSLGTFATAEEAALCVARSPEGQAAAERPAAAVPKTSEEARQQAHAEGLTLRVAENKTGYSCVYLHAKPGQPKPYQAQVKRGGKKVHLGSFATAEEAALCVARSPEGRAAARLAAAAERPKGMLPATPSGASLKEEGTVPPLPPGTFVKGEGVVPPMPHDAFVKVEVIVKEEEGSGGRPKRQRVE